MLYNQLSIQIRTLRQLQAAEAQRKADTERLLATLTPLASNVDLDKTPKQKAIALPPEPSPPPYTITSSGGTDNSTGTFQTQQDSITTSSGGRTSGQPSETAQSPPPTPDSQDPMAKASHLSLHPPPAPEEVRAQLTSLVERQNSLDHALDLQDLRSLMREALATSSDAEMLHVLQINREDIAEAMKTLQRALEAEREKEESDETESGSPEMESEETAEADSQSKGGALGLMGLKRRLTMDSVTTMATRKSKTSKKEDQGSRRSGKSDRDTLDREFIETGIDALRRLSRGQDINLPSWTITR